MDDLKKINILGGHRLLLGSNSPRRRELIEQLGIPVTILPPVECDESFPAMMRPEEVAEFISRKKAHPYMASLNDNEILLTADTVVINRGEVLGKPHSERDAIAMLVNLSGHVHNVVTGVTLTTLKRQISFSENTEVEFGELLPEEIEHYVKAYAPFDKAGAYGIQEWIGQIGIRAIRGDFYNVMGLPLRAVYQNLRRLGVKHY